MESQTASYTLTTKSLSLSNDVNPAFIDRGPYSMTDNNRTVTVVWGRNIFEETQNFTFNFEANTTFKEILVPSCSVDDTVDFSFTIASTDGQAIPDWIEFNETDLTLSGTTPELDYDETFSYHLFSNWTDIPFPNTTQTITIEVKGLVLPATTAGAVAVAATQGQTAAIGALSFGTSVLNGSPPITLWAIISQLQIIILMLLIDDYTPEDINQYIEGVGFIMCNFNFIPFNKAPGISVSTEWMTFGDPFGKIKKLGFNSLSTFVNNISLLISFIILFTLHMILKSFIC